MYCCFGLCYRVRSLSGTVMWLRLDAFATNDKTMGDDINRRLGVIHSVFFSALAVQGFSIFSGPCSNRWCFFWEISGWEIPVSIYVCLCLHYNLNISKLLYLHFWTWTWTWMWICDVCVARVCCMCDDTSRLFWLSLSRPSSHTTNRAKISKGHL